VDVRVVAAANEPLEKRITEGTFREDLYYRLNVIQIQLPPLRDRRDDIPLLIAHFLSRRQRPGCDRFHVSRRAMEFLESWAWPGNVRELENAIERAVILSDGATISSELLAIESSRASHRESGGPVDQTSLEDYFVSFVLANQDQLTETELADKLGISRKCLWERRQRLNIPRKRTRQRGPRRDEVSQIDD
jgi:DNA-binding NtrC family response regulator